MQVSYIGHASSIFRPHSAMSRQYLAGAVSRSPFTLSLTTPTVATSSLAKQHLVAQGLS